MNFCSSFGSFCRTSDEHLLADVREQKNMNTLEKKLADLVRRHPNLYDHGRQDYKDNVRGHSSWKEIAGDMGKTEDEVKLIWKNLRDKFCKAKRRMASRRRDSLPERPGPVLFVQLSWLNPFVKPKGTVLGDTVEVCLKKIPAFI